MNSTTEAQAVTLTTAYLICGAVVGGCLVLGGASVAAATVAAVALPAQYLWRVLARED